MKATGFGKPRKRGAKAPLRGISRHLDCILVHGVASRSLPNYLGWHWALDGGRVTSVEQLLRSAFGLIHT